MGVRASTGVRRSAAAYPETEAKQNLCVFGPAVKARRRWLFGGLLARSGQRESASGHPSRRPAVKSRPRVAGKWCLEL